MQVKNALLTGCGSDVMTNCYYHTENGQERGACLDLSFLSALCYLDVCLERDFPFQNKNRSRRALAYQNN